MRRNHGGCHPFREAAVGFDFYVNDQRVSVSKRCYVYALHFFLDEVDLTCTRNAEGEGEGGTEEAARANLQTVTRSKRDKEKESIMLRGTWPEETLSIRERDYRDSEYRHARLENDRVDNENRGNRFSFVLSVLEVPAVR